MNVENIEIFHTTTVKITSYDFFIDYFINNNEILSIEDFVDSISHKFTHSGASIKDLSITNMYLIPMNE